MNVKDIATKDRLIFALDYPSVDAAKQAVIELGDTVSFYKLGLELFTAGGYFKLIKWLQERNKKIFIDLKFFDVPQTVASAVKQISNYGVEFTTVHGNDSILQAAVKSKGKLKILAVTMLTSLDEGDAKSLGFDVSIEDVVLSRAKRALDLGCDGIVSSGIEVPKIREKVGEKLIIVSPGIRPFINNDDQRRVVDIKTAFTNGADYIVVGRPIKEHHGYVSSKQAAEMVQQQITEVFSNSHHIL